MEEKDNTQWSIQVESIIYPLHRIGIREMWRVHVTTRIWFSWYLISTTVH